MKPFFLLLTTVLIALPAAAQSLEPAGDSHDCGLPTRLIAGRDAYVVGPEMQPLYEEPTVSATIDGYVTDATDIVLPSSEMACADGYTWWWVDADGQTGWIAEANSDTYFYQLAPENRNWSNPAGGDFRTLVQPRSIRYNADATQLFVSSWDGLQSYTIAGFDPDTTEQFRDFQLSNDLLVQVEASPSDPNMLLTVDDQNSITMWAFAQRRRVIWELMTVPTPEGVPENAPRAHFSGDGESLYVLQEGRLTGFHVTVDHDTTLDLGIAKVTDFVVSEDGTQIIVASLDIGLDFPAVTELVTYTWKGEGWTETRRFDRGDFDAPVTALRLSPDEEALFAADSRGNLQRWAMIDASRIDAPAATNEERIIALDIDASGQTLAVGYDRPLGAIALFDARTLVEQNRLTFPNEAGPVHDLAFHPTEPIIAAVVGYIPRVIDTETMTVTSELYLTR